MKRFPFIAAGIVLGLTLTCCGQDPKDAPKTVETEQVLEPPVTCTILTTGAIAAIDPHLAETKAEQHIAGALFEGLLIPDPKTGAPLPGLAESWSVSDDRKRYTFYLRDSSWTDGTQITAGTVVQSWLRMLKPRTEAPFAAIAADLIQGAKEYNAGEKGPEHVGIRALDPRTFQVDLVKPAPYALQTFTRPAFAVVPLHSDRFIRKDPDVFVGNGAFRLETVAPKETESADMQYTLVKNESYWNAAETDIDRVFFESLSDAEAAYRLYTEGKVDWLMEIPEGYLPDGEKGEHVQVYPILATYFYIYQTEKPPFHNAKVRKALALAIDKRLLAEVPASGFIPPLLEYPGIGENRVDVELAQTYLAEAGYPEGTGFPAFEILFNTSDENRRIAADLRRQWRDHLGITCTLVEKDWISYLALRSAGAFTVVRAGWKSDFNDPLRFLSLFTSGGPYNCGRYSSREFDKLLEKARESAAVQERMELLRQAEEILITQDQVILPLFHYVRYNMIDTEIWGGWHTNIFDYHPLQNMFLAD